MKNPNITDTELTVGALMQELSRMNPTMPVRVAVSYRRLSYCSYSMEFETEHDFTEATALLPCNMRVAPHPRSGDVGLHIVVDGGVTVDTAQQYYTEGRD
jgi:hypothetical protein